MWPLRLLYGLWLGREEAADDWHLRIICVEIPQDMVDKQETSTMGCTLKHLKKSRHDAVVKDPKEEMSLVLFGTHFFNCKRPRGIDVLCNCRPIAFMWRSELISNNKNVQTTSFNRKQKTRHGLFFGARRARLPCPSCWKKSSMTLEDPLNQPECYRILQDIKFSRSPGTFFSYLKQWRVQWGWGIPCQHLFKRYGNVVATSLDKMSYGWYHSFYLAILSAATGKERWSHESHDPKISKGLDWRPPTIVTLNHLLGGGNSNIFYFHPELFGEMIQFDEHIFQMGWFNHQLAWY